MSNNNEEEVKLKKVRIAIDIVPGSRTDIILQELKEEKGIKSSPSIFLEALSTLHRKTFPGTYYSTKASASRLAGEEDEEFNTVKKEEKKARQIKIRENIRHRKLLALAEKLDDAEVYLDNNEIWKVRYFTYSGPTRYSRIVPLDSITEDHIKNQFFPNKETVMQLIADGKANFNIELKESSKLENI